MEKTNKISLAEKVYSIILVVSYMFSGAYLIMQKKYNIEEILFIGIIVFMGYLYTWKMYLFVRKDTYKRNKIRFVVNYKKLNWFMIVYMFIMIIYSIKTGDGAAESAKLNSSSIFASLWVPDAIFAFYYCMCRERYRRPARFVAILYTLYKILLGWSGVILLVAILELYYIFKNRKIDILRTFFITVIAFIGGGTLYAFMHPLKYAIRYGTVYNFKDHLSILEGIANLANRIAHLEATLYVNSNLKKVIDIYKGQGVGLAEFKAIFRPLVPSRLMRSKIFSSIGSCIYNAQSGYSGINITNNTGILYYYRLLFECDLLSFWFCAFMFVLFVWMLKKMYNAFQTTPGQFNIIYFWLFVQGYSICGTIENWIANSYIKIIFFIPLFLMLGIIKICKRSRCLCEDRRTTVYESITS